MTNTYLSNIRKVYANQFGSYFIDHDDNVYACGTPAGSNSPLQGLIKSPAPYNNVIYPQQITSLTNVKSLSIRSWGDNNGGVVLHMDGTISSWTNISKVGHQQSLAKVTDISGNPIEDVVEVTCGTNYTIIRRNIQGNNVLSFGMNDIGQLGRSTVDNYDRDVRPITNITGAIEIASGRDHCLALVESGEIYSWGNNDNDYPGVSHVADKLGRTITNNSK